MTERARLTDALALATRPREREYAIHDTTLQGFMLRVQPDGARSWVFRYRRDGKPRRVTLGKPGAVKADEARAAALGFLAREKGGGKPLPPPPSGPRLAKFAAEYVKRRSPAWKPSTRDSVRSYLDSAILARSRRSPRQRGRARRCRPLLPRVRTPQAGRREPLSRDTALHVRLRHRLGPSARGRREPLLRHRTLPPSASRAAARRGGLGQARRCPAAARRRMPAPRRGGAADPADRMQAGRDTPPAMVRGQAGPARAD